MMAHCGTSCTTVFPCAFWVPSLALDVMLKNDNGVPFTLDIGPDTGLASSHFISKPSVHMGKLSHRAFHGWPPIPQLVSVRVCVPQWVSISR